VSRVASLLFLGLAQGAAAADGGTSTAVLCKDDPKVAVYWGHWSWFPCGQIPGSPSPEMRYQPARNACQLVSLQAVT